MNTYTEFINEGKWSTIMNDVKSGSQSGPWSIVIIKDKKVVHQQLVNVRDAIPANYEGIRKMFKYATLSIEDNEGKIVYSEKI